MAKRFTIAPMYKGNDNQWKITWLDENNEEVGLHNLYEVAVVGLYHCIAKELNNKFGYNFKYDENEIKRVRNAPQTTIKSFTNGDWYLEKRWSELHLMHNRPQICPTDYGDFPTELIVGLITELGEWLEENDIHRLSYENCKINWLMYKHHGVIFQPYEQYKHFFDADPDFSADAFAIAKRERAIAHWQRDSEDAFVLWNTPCEEVRFLGNRKCIRFYRRDDMVTSYTYPPLHELKKDPQFIKDIVDCLVESNQYMEEEFDNWIKSDCDLPPFPISVIFHSDYQNYKFVDYEER